MKTRIGHLLVREDFVTDAQLSRALEVQNFAGGRIGTLLLERAALGEDDLGKTLALQQGCGYVAWNALSALPPETLGILPPRIALKHNAIPYECGEGYVRMALRDPNDLRALDELVFVTGRKVIAGVAPEVRIYQALEKYYGKVRTPRYAILAERLSRLQKVPVAGPSGSLRPEATGRARALTEPAAPMPPRESNRSSKTPGRPTGTGGISESPSVAWSSFLPASAEPDRAGEPEQIAWDESTGGRSRLKGSKEPKSIPLPAPIPVAEGPDSAPLKTTPKEPAPEPSAPPPEPDFSRVLAETERDAIANAVLAALVPRFPSAAIFSSRSSHVAGWDAAGDGVDPEGLRSFSVSLAEPSVFHNSLFSGNFYLGPLPSLRCHDPLAAAMGGWPGECLVRPIFLGARPVAFLFASSPSPGSFSESDLTFVQGLGNAAASALANAIRLKKREI